MNANSDEFITEIIFIRNNASLVGFFDFLWAAFEAALASLRDSFFFVASIKSGVKEWLIRKLWLNSPFGLNTNRSLGERGVWAKICPLIPQSFVPGISLLCALWIPSHNTYFD